MQLSGVCIYTENAPQLAAFYEIALRETPTAEGEHYGFAQSQLAVYNPGNVRLSEWKNMSLMFYCEDVAAEYARVTTQIPGIGIVSPPERRPWGAYSFWFTDPDGNMVSFIEKASVSNAQT